MTILEVALDAASSFRPCSTGVSASARALADRMVSHTDAAQKGLASIS